MKSKFSRPNSLKDNDVLLVQRGTKRTFFFGDTFERDEHKAAVESRAGESEKLSLLDAYLRTCDPDESMLTDRINVEESRMDREKVEIAHNGVRRDDEVKATGQSQ